MNKCESKSIFEAKIAMSCSAQRMNDKFLEKSDLMDRNLQYSVTGVNLDSKIDLSN